LRAVACVSEGPFGQILLTRLAPIEAQFLPKDLCRVKLALAGDTFPPKVVFKVSLMSKGAVCYLSGRRALKADVDGAISMMGERNFCAQLTSDLIERKNNRGVIDEIDVGTEEDLARLKAYTDNSSCLIGGKDNGWRRVDLRTLPRAAPFRDLYEVVQSKRLSHLPPSFWAQPRNQAHLETQIEILLADEATLEIPKPVSIGEKEEKRQKMESKKMHKMKELYLSDNNSEKTDQNNKINIVDFEPVEFDNEARELYEWSQYL